MARPGSKAQEGEVSLGTISGVFGIDGELRLFLHNRQSDLLAQERAVVLALPDGSRRPARMRARPGAGGRVLARVDGVDTPEAAAKLQDAEILFPREALPALPEGSWYHAELLGLPVRTASGRDLGKLAEIHGAGGTDVWLIRGPEGETYIPALSANLVRVAPGEEIVVTDESVPVVL